MMETQVKTEALEETGAPGLKGESGPLVVVHMYEWRLLPEKLNSHRAPSIKTNTAHRQGKKATGLHERTDSLTRMC